MTDQEKEIAYYKASACQSRTGEKPPFVPSMVRLDTRVHDDWPNGHHLQVGPGDFPCECNQYGAVSVRAENGKMLGLRLDEFKPIAWRENTNA